MGEVMEKSIEVEIDYSDKKCPECGAWAFIPDIVTDICQECWEEQKFVQYFYMENVGKDKRFSSLPCNPYKTKELQFTYKI